MRLLQVFCILLVSIAMALSLAHALELPGKMRLDERTYRAVQRIYYPGFTCGGGVGEFGGLLSTLILLITTPRDGGDFALTLVALACLVGMQAIYWTITHPVNREWLAGERLNRGGAEFFAAGARAETTDWMKLRNRWEVSHVARAELGFVAFMSLLIAVALVSERPTNGDRPGGSRKEAKWIHESR